MAIFGKKKEKKVTPEKEVVKEVALKEEVKAKPKKKADSPVSTIEKDISHVLRAPRITEKATFASENGVYVFEVDTRATKIDIAQAVETIYKVKPVKVNVTKIPAKKVRTKSRNVFGTKSGGKKAYVYLKKGDTIEIV